MPCQPRAPRQPRAPHQPPRPPGLTRHGTLMKTSVDQGPLQTHLFGQPGRVVVDEDHGGPLRHPLGHHGVQRGPRPGVQPGPSLVHDQQPGPAEQGLGHRHLLAGALGQLAHGQARVRAQPEPVDRPEDRVVQRAAVQPVQPPEVGQIRLGRERQPGREPLRHVARPGPAGYPSPARHRGPAHQPQQRRLAAAVGPGDPDQLTGDEVRVDVPQYPRTPNPVTLADTPQLHPTSQSVLPALGNPVTTGCCGARRGLAAPRRWPGRSFAGCGWGR